MSSAGVVTGADHLAGAWEAGAGRALHPVLTAAAQMAAQIAQALLGAVDRGEQATAARAGRLMQAGWILALLTASSTAGSAAESVACTGQGMAEAQSAVSQVGRGPRVVAAAPAAHTAGETGASMAVPHAVVLLTLLPTTLGAAGRRLQSSFQAPSRHTPQMLHGGAARSWHRLQVAAQRHHRLQVWQQGVMLRSPLPPLLPTPRCVH